MFYPGFTFFVGHQTQISNRATYDVCSPKAVETLFYEYSTLYLVKNISPFIVIEAL